MENAAWAPIPCGFLMRAMQGAWTGFGSLWRARRSHRSLQVKESAGLGERRFVAVVQFERQRFLVGGGPGSVTLLAQLADGEEPAPNRVQE